MPDYTPFKQGFIFCLMIFVAIWAVGHFGGCEGTPTSTKTEFSTPTSQPSVSPAIKTVSDDEGDLQGDVNDAGPMVDELTQTNLPDKKPPLQKKVKSIQDKTKKLGDDLVTAKEKSDENDAAGVAIAKERDDARALVITTEEKAAAQKAKDDKAIASANSAKERLMDLMMLSVVALGGLLIVGGVLIFGFAKNPQGGSVVGGAGLLICGLGFAGFYFGWWFGLVGFVLFIVGIVFAMWAAIHFTKVDGKTTIQAVQQAKLSGVIPESSWETFKDMLSSAQTPGAKAMVAAETK